MKKNSKTIATLLLVVIAAALLFLAYYFFLKPRSQNMLVGGGLIPESGLATDFGGLSSQAGRELLFLLDDLRSISFNAEFIQGQGFLNLQDFSRPIDPQTPGRENPFAPVQ